jgi:hypothetical protein
MEAGGAHEPGHAFAAHGDTTGTKGPTQAWATVRLPTVGVREPQLRD